MSKILTFFKSFFEKNVKSARFKILFNLFMKQYLPYPFLLSLLFIVFSCSSDSDEPTPPEPDVIAPSIAINIAGSTSSGSGETPVYSNQITVNINAQDANGVAKVEAFINDQKVGEDTTAPFEITIDLSGYTSKMPSSGKFQDYTLKIVATDTSGNQSSTEQVFNVDNELPFIANVTLQNGTIINGDTNGVSFEVTDNEGLFSIKAFMNNTLLQEFSTAPYELNVNTLDLTDGENTLRIEAVDLANNTATFDVAFVSDNTGPEIILNTELNKVYDPVTITSDINDNFSNVQSVEFLLGEQSLALFENGAIPSYELIPDNFSVGTNILRIVATDDLSNVSNFEMPFEIERKLITINIPENRINPAITLPVVFISKMDGSLVTQKILTENDRQVVLSSSEEFLNTDEFMLSFYFQDNGGAVGISTHQNLTRVNPGTLNIQAPIRLSVAASYQLPTANFLSNDVVISGGGEDGVSNAFYSAYVNTSQGNFSLSTATLENGSIDYESFYFYNALGGSGYTYFVADNPFSEGFVLDKSNFTTNGVEIRNFVIDAAQPIQNQPANLTLFGYTSLFGLQNKLFHQIYHRNFTGNTGIGQDYYLNTGLYDYKHQLLFGNYYTERNGAPETSYTVPNVSLDYTIASNVVSLNIQGDEHIVGRIQCMDFENTNYDWFVTFNSKTTTNVVMPQLPDVINHPVKTAQENNSLKIESVELLSYESILTYDDYLDQVVKNQKNVLDATGWYQLIYASRTGAFNRPNREFIFQ